MSQSLTIYYDPKLIEETVFQAQSGTALAREFDDERRRVYDIPDPETRERSFQDLFSRWFARLALSQPITAAVQEQPFIIPAIEACYVVRALHAKQEGAELYVAHQDRGGDTTKRTLRITLRPESLLDAAALQPLLRNELLHIADMLDPAFGYEPALPQSPDGPTYDSFITNRYRVLWNVTIGGRMARRGWLPASARERALVEFAAAFPMLHSDSEPLFQRFYDDDRPDHATLAAFAFDPTAGGEARNESKAATSHCPLCKFPTQTFEPAPHALADDVRQAITGDFPDWLPERGLCRQCADLYRGRQMSLAALKTLPGWNSAE